MARSVSTIVASGDRFNRLTVLGECRVNGRRGLRCRCDCGTVIERELHSVTTGNTKSCGCLYRDSRGTGGRRTHGLSGGPHYGRWRQIMARCYDPKNHAYARYGGIGVTVHLGWHDVSNFVAFLETELGQCPEGWSLDRIDPHGNYEPSNVRWASPHTQRVNRRAA